MKRLLTVWIAGALVMATGGARAQFAKLEDAVKYRQSVLTLLGTHFGRVGAMVQGRAPFDAKVAQENMDIVMAVARLPWAAFIAGAESPKTKAEIWLDSEKFKELADRTQVELTRLQAAANTGDLEKMKSVFGAAARSCKTCHDAFRK